jgi:hypothetical protein
MRLAEFTDSTTYTSTDTDATDCLKQIERLRTHSVEADDVPFLARPKKQRRQNDRAKLSDKRRTSSVSSQSEITSAALMPEFAVSAA